MTSGTWDRHRGHSAGYDVVGLGYNYRMDEPRAALLLARLAGLEEDIARSPPPGAPLPGDARATSRADRALPRRGGGRLLLLRDAGDARGRGAPRPASRPAASSSRVQTSVLYPAIHEFTAYERLRVRALPRSELAARTELTLPLFPTLTEADQDRVVSVLRESLAALHAERSIA